MKERYFKLSLFALFFIVNVIGVQSASGTDIEVELLHDGTVRDLYIQLPPQIDKQAQHARGDLPLLIVLHGAGVPARRMMRIADFDHAAGDYVIVYPDGLSQDWNHEHEPGPDTPNDVGFIAAVRQYMIDNWPVDPDKVFLVGHSNGGLMALRANCQLPGQFAAIAVVGANYTFQLMDWCLDSSPTSHLFVLGTADFAFPWDGSISVSTGQQITTRLSVAQSLDYLRTLYNCRRHPPVITTVDEERQIAFTSEIYLDCDAQVVVQVIGLIGQHHDFPYAPIIDLEDGDIITVQQRIMSFFDAADQGA